MSKSVCISTRTPFTSPSRIFLNPPLLVRWDKARKNIWQNIAVTSATEVIINRATYSYSRVDLRAVFHMKDEQCSDQHGHQDMTKHQQYSRQAPIVLL